MLIGIAWWAAEPPRWGQAVVGVRVEGGPEGCGPLAWGHFGGGRGQFYVLRPQFHHVLGRGVEGAAVTASDHLERWTCLCIVTLSNAICTCTTHFYGLYTLVSAIESSLDPETCGSFFSLGLHFHSYFSGFRVDSLSFHTRVEKIWWQEDYSTTSSIIVEIKCKNNPWK